MNITPCSKTLGTWYTFYVYIVIQQICKFCHISLFHENHHSWSLWKVKSFSTNPLQNRLIMNNASVFDQLVALACTCQGNAWLKENDFFTTSFYSLASFSYTLPWQTVVQFVQNVSNAYWYNHLCNYSLFIATKTNEYIIIYLYSDIHISLLKSFDVFKSAFLSVMWCMSA